MITQHQQGFNQRTGLLAGCHQQRGFGGYLVRHIDCLAGQHHEAGNVLRLVCQVAFQHLQAIQRAARFAAERRDGGGISLRHFFHRRRGAFGVLNFPVRIAVQELAALLERLRMTVNRFDRVQVR